MDDDLLAEVADATVRRSGMRCSLCTALDSVDEELRDTVAHLLSMPVEKAGNSAIARALQKRGINVSYQVVARCRKADGWTTIS